MRREHWVMPLVFVLVALPLGLALLAFGVGNDATLLAAVVAGGIAASGAQARLRAGAGR